VVRIQPAAAGRRSWVSREDRLFVDAALNGGAPPVTALDGYRSVELALACYRSVAEGRRITI